MSKRVAAVILTFHPGPEVVTNIVAVLNQVDKVYLVSNSYDQKTEDLLYPLQNQTRIQAIHFAENMGVASGFNAGIKAAFQDGFDFFVLFDQDSLPEAGMVQGLLAAYENCRGAVGIIGPKLIDRQSGRVFDAEIGTYPQKLIISSGSFFARDLVKEIGYLRDDYFIDYVDHEYCLRALKAGRLNYCCADVSLRHQFGEPQLKHFFGFTCTVSNYSEFRHFYMARNRVLLIRDHGFKYWFKSDMQHFLKMYLKIALFEEKKIKKFFAILRGTFIGVVG